MMTDHPEYMRQIEDWAAAHDREPAPMTPQEFGAILDEIYPEQAEQAKVKDWIEAWQAGQDALVSRIWGKVPWRTRFLYHCLDFAGILRYLVTGNCGYGGCGYATFYRYWDHCRRCIRNDMCQYSGERVRPFVPEAGCPVHDGDSRLSRWAQKVRKTRCPGS